MLQAQVIINELSYNPCTTQGGDGDCEFIELYNTGASAVDLSTYTLDDPTFAFPAGTMIAAGEHIVVADNADPVTGISTCGYAIPAGTQIFQWTSGNLGNSSESVSLLDGGVVVDMFFYDDGPCGADGDCNSLQYGGTGDNSDCTLGNWAAATPNPGATNNVTVVCSISNAFISNAGCVGADYLFDVTFSAANASGSYKIVDITDAANPVDLVTGLAATTTTITLTANTSTTSIDIVVQDEADATCASNTLTVNPIDCSFTPVCANAGDLVITEIMHSPDAVNDLDGEYIEIYNTTANAIDIQGYQLEDSGANPHTIASSVTVPAMGYAVLGLDADMAVNGGYTPDYVYSGFTLGSSDLVQISCSGTVIDVVDFSAAGFPAAMAASLSLDMAILDATMNDAGANWCPSSASTLTSTDLGTPGMVNPSCPVVTCPSTAFINEFHYDDDGGDANELVEVAIPTGEDATGVTITLYNGNGGASYSSYTLTAADLIGSDATYDYYVWYTSLQNGGPDGIALDCDGTLIEFLSYEGSFAATNGVANGVTSTDIGVAESTTGLDTESLQLIGGVWVGPIPATAGATNVLPPCAITDVTVTGACNGVDYEYTVAFTATSGSGMYEVVDNATMTVLGTTTMTSATITIAASVSTTPFDIFVRDMVDVACASVTATVTPEDCSAPACPTDLTLTTAEVGSMTYQVSNNITSTDTVDNGEVVVYDAGNCIELPADFEVILGAEFDAIIGGCSPFTGENTSDK